MLWSKSFETGNELVDEQHKEIFRLVQQVLDADAFANRKAQIETALDFLSGYAVRHFASEEALMAESNYPAFEEHKAQHDSFVKEVVAFMERVKTEGGTISISETINNFVIEWLKEHIMDRDKAMADHYKGWQVSN